MITYEQFLFRYHFWDLVKSKYTTAEIKDFTGWSIKYVNTKKYHKAKSKHKWRWSKSALLKLYQRRNEIESLSTEVDS